ncbi:acyl-CoA desaturase [Jannaschia sp. CCS1]|uniref:acyl-CoA desaturase n=1 Tax=Jannaschia sp. (strain CCS1) TaxID=290400 RepID=UPI000053B814|nr:acyl-CoA desaturase [Jannaschia sp. CCS1]ABD53627.1 fatty acid desaturase [Jannaschia sp. CCS1]
MSRYSPLIDTDRVFADPQTSATHGQIRWTPAASLWLLGHVIGGVLALTVFPSSGGVAAFLILSGATLCAGHSVGMHRLLIHRSFTAPKWLERGLVWLGTLVGMAGPFGMIRAHDMRDWHQRQADCPPHPSHGAGWVRDAWWQLCCRFDLTHPPRFEIEQEVTEDPWYHWMERHWRAQQLIPAIVLFALGGVGLMLWGVCLRVSVSLIGHWAVGHAAHKGGHQGSEVRGLPVQGYNLRGLGLLSFGECFHGNHHAFPHSAKLGVEAGQIDPGFWLIRILEAVGLAWDVKGPGFEPARDGLARVTEARDTFPSAIAAE